MADRRVVTAIGAALLAMVAGFEGTRLQAYRDPVGIPTICDGHTGPEVRMGQRATPEQCQAMLAEDLAKARGQVLRCFDADKLSPPQLDALTSAMYNIGPGRAGVKDGLCVLKSGHTPRIRAYANAGQCRAAADQFLSWANAGGKPLPGLQARRSKEREMFLGGCHD